MNAGERKSDRSIFNTDSKRSNYFEQFDHSYKTCISLSPVCSVIAWMIYTQTPCTPYSSLQSEMFHLLYYLYLEYSIRSENCRIDLMWQNFACFTFKWSLSQSVLFLVSRNAQSSNISNAMPANHSCVEHFPLFFSSLSALAASRMAIQISIAEKHFVLGIGFGCELVRFILRALF